MVVEYEDELFPGMIVTKSSNGGEVKGVAQIGNGLERRTNCFMTKRQNYATRTWTEGCI